MSDTDPVVERAGLRAGQSSPATWRRVVRGRHRDRDYTLRRALLLADVGGLWLALALALAVAGGRGAPLLDSLWMLPALPAWGFLFWCYGLYVRPVRRLEPVHVDDLASLFHALVIGSLGMWLFYRLVVPAPQLDLGEMLVFGAAALPLIAGLRIAMRAVNQRIQGPERVFAVAPPADVKMLRAKLRRHPEYAMALVGALSDGSAAEIQGLHVSDDLDDIDQVMASLRVDHLTMRLDAGYESQELARELMWLCHREGVRFSCFTGVRGLLLPGSEVGHIGGLGVLASSPPVLSRSARIAKRGMDVVGAGLLLALLALPLGLMALAIKLNSRGPVLYKQLRVGRDGERFRALKFRTMVEGADEMDDELMERSVDPDWLVLDEDPRVTGVGRFLRRWSLDELPQLWNVVVGEMSLVGPRPLSERDDLRVEGQFRHRVDVRPGLTGYWQVAGRNNIPFREMLELDYAYLANWSLWHDVKILLRTVPAVLLRRGSN